LVRLFTDKPDYIWETKIVSKINLKECDKNKLEKFYSDIKSSERVSNFIKQKNLIIQNIFAILQKKLFLL
jgi:ATP-dependent DNA helicase RecG